MPLFEINALFYSTIDCCLKITISSDDLTKYNSKEERLGDYVIVDTNEMIAYYKYLQDGSKSYLIFGSSRSRWEVR